MDIRVLMQKKAELTKQARGILDAAGPDGLSPEQQIEYDQVKAKLEQVNASIAACEEQMERERQMEAVPSLSRSHKVSVGDHGFESDPKGGFMDHRDFLQAVMDAGSGRKFDIRLKRFQATQGSDEQGVYSDPYGGFLVPGSIAPGVLSLQPEDDPIAPLVTRVPMRTPMVKFNARVDKNHSASVSGGLTVTRRPETQDGTPSRMQFEPIEMNAHELFGLAYATESILVDSPESFIAILSAGFRDEFAGHAIDERLNGTGAGEFLGVMKSGCLITVNKEGGQAADTVVTENIDKMSARCWRYNRAVWLANPTTKPQLMGLVRAVGTGGAPVLYYMPSQGNGPDILLGRPIFFSEYCAALGDKGDLLLGVWSEYLEGLYQGLQQAESIHVRFISNERTFKFWLRNDGQPWWKTALTPKNGDTLSPFVTLQAR